MIWHKLQVICHFTGKRRDMWKRKELQRTVHVCTLWRSTRTYTCTQQVSKDLIQTHNFVLLSSKETWVQTLFTLTLSPPLKTGQCVSKALIFPPNCTSTRQQQTHLYLSDRQQLWEHSQQHPNLSVLHFAEKENKYCIKR